MPAILTGPLFDFYRQQIERLEAKEATETLTEQEAQVLAEHRTKWKGAVSPQMPILGFSMRDMLILIVVVKLSKTSQGLQVLKELGKSFFRMIGDALDSLGKASAANPVTAWANPYLISIVLERFGMVAPERMLEFRIGLSLISGAQVAEGFVDTLSSIVPFSPHDPSDFPTTVNLGDKTTIEGIVSRLGEAAAVKAIEEE